MPQSPRADGRTWRSRFTVLAAARLLAVALVAAVIGGVSAAGPAGAAGAEEAAGKAQAPALAASGVVRLVNNVSRRCVEVEGASGSEGARIQQWGCGTGSHRRWIADDLGNGFVQYPNQSSGLCLTALWGSVGVTQTACDTSDIV